MPTLYGLLLSQDASLTHWPRFDTGQFLFQGSADDRIAGVTSSTQARGWLNLVLWVAG